MRTLLLLWFLVGILIPTTADAAVTNPTTSINIRPGKTDCSNFSVQPDSTGQSIDFTVGDPDVQSRKQYAVEINPGCNPILSASTTPPAGAFGYIRAIFTQKVADPCHALIFNNPSTSNKVYLYEVDSTGNKISSPLCTAEYAAQAIVQANPSSSSPPPECQTTYEFNTSRGEVVVRGTGVPTEVKRVLVIEDSLLGKLTPLPPHFDVSVDSNGEFATNVGKLDPKKTYDIQLQKPAALGMFFKVSCKTTKITGPVRASEPIRCTPLDQPADSGINTALGCIPVGSTNEFVGWFLRWAIGIAGGVAFILMLIAGFQIMTAAGNPERLQGGRELLNAAVSGLVLIIFSVFLLKLIGVDVLALPGFGK